MFGKVRTAISGVSAPLYIWRTGWRSIATSGSPLYRTAMFEEATREFRRVVELQDSDVQARFFLSLVSRNARGALDRGGC